MKNKPTSDSDAERHLNRDNADIVQENTEKAEIKKENKGEYGGNFLLAFIFIFLGLLFLANNLGLLPWYVWSEVWKYWPIFLILFGIRVLFGKSLVARIIMAILSLLVLLFVFLYIAMSGGLLQNSSFENIPLIRRINRLIIPDLVKKSFVVAGYSFENVQSRILTINSGIGRLVMSDADSDDYVILRAEYPGGFTAPEVDTKIQNNTLDIRMELTGEGKFNGLPGNSTRLNYDAVIGRQDIETNLTIHVGAGTADAEFDNLSIKKFVIDVGVGSANILLSAQTIPSEEMTLHVGIGKINIKLPEEIGIMVNHSVGLGRFTIDGQSIREDGIYKTDNYDRSDKKLMITADVGAGAIEINRE